ncbi:Vps51/Vps67 family of vesicular protein [Perilla frutescens var. frutescens]|nr:Vps51/Vps67 family of vesicular protein [Perilla frutescens var. frutescens]
MSGSVTIAAVCVILNGRRFNLKGWEIISVQSRSDGVNTSLFEKREHIEKLHRRKLLRKVQVLEC